MQDLRLCTARADAVKGLGCPRGHARRARHIGARGWPWPSPRPGQAGGGQKEPFVRGLWAEICELWTGGAEEAVVRRLRKKARRANECESQGSSGNGGGRPRQLSTALRGAAARGLAAALE